MSKGVKKKPEFSESINKSIREYLTPIDSRRGISTIKRVIKGTKFRGVKS